MQHPIGERVLMRFVSKLVAASVTLTNGIVYSQCISISFRSVLKRDMCSLSQGQDIVKNVRRYNRGNFVDAVVDLLRSRICHGLRRIV